MVFGHGDREIRGYCLTRRDFTMFIRQRLEQLADCVSEHELNKGEMSRSP